MPSWKNGCASAPRVIDGKIDVGISDDPNDIISVQIVGFETISNWDEQSSGWQFLQFKGCAQQESMKRWQKFMKDICYTEKQGQLDTLGSETVNANFLRCCHKNKDFQHPDIKAPWSVESDVDYDNMPIVVWADVTKKSKQTPGRVASSQQPPSQKGRSRSRSNRRCHRSHNQY